MTGSWFGWWVGGSAGSDGRLEWASPALVIQVAMAVAVLAWLGAWWTGRGSARSSRVPELLLWAGALAVLTFSVSGPTWVEEAGRREPGRIVALVDGSASMGVVEDGRPRGDVVQGLLDRTIHPTDVYSFGEDLQAGAPEGWTANGTDLGVALSALADRFLGQHLQGVVVITDGIDRGALRRELQDEGTVVPPALPGPVTFYQVGQVRDVHDLAVDDVITGGFAFVYATFSMKARIRGPAGTTVPVTLAREGRLVAERDAVLDDDGRAEVEFQVTPKQPGRFAWEVSVPVDDGDAVPGNNTFPVVIKVVRDRTRVLQVSGSPSYDQKFLRLFLKDDPSVDLVSFFILRTREDFGAGWNSRELSLIAFPYRRLFSEDLDTFDLVILQNFDYEPYFLNRGPDSQLLANLADYVRKGGALLMTGGDRSFDLANYGPTPLAEVLPVGLGLSGARTDDLPFQPQLTRAGEAHPVTRLAAEADESKAIWRRLPAMDGLNLTAGTVEGAATLVAHPTLKTANGEPMPVLSVREVEKGRTMALTVDSSWRWSFSEAAVGRGNQAYLRFWKSAMRWLVADPEDRRVVVTPSQENVLLGDEVRLVVRVRDAGYQPVSGVVVQVKVESVEGIASEFDVVTDASGEGSNLFRPEVRGPHRVTVRAGNGAGDWAETVFAVSSRDPELVEIVPDQAFLERLAEIYDGELRRPGDLSGPLLDASAGRTVMDRRETPLSTAPLAALLFGLLSSAAWWTRRRSGAR